MPKKTEIEDSPLLRDLNDDVKERPLYSEDEEVYIRGLRKRLENARNQRDQEYEEFDGMSYVQNYQLNERVANTFLQPKQNKEDTNFQSGTVRQKLFALLSALVNLNISGDISAYDAQGLKIQALGDAMEDVILKTNELDNDDEKKYLRQYELLKHGTVFVEELWDERSKIDKKFKSGKYKWDGKVTGEEQWVKRIKKAFARPTRNIVSGLNVYLGDITKYDISEQPFIFTVDVRPYEEAKMIFGDWERWDKVSRTIKRFDETQNASGPFNKDWTLLEVGEGNVEIIRYQDKWNNEFGIILNGVLMTPVGLPLPWGYEDYNVVQQNLEPINAKFAYGKSMVSRIRNKVALFDEMLRLAVLKTQKSFMPPYVNVSGRVLSNRVLMPGKISHGIPPNSLVPINDKETQGVSTAEFNMIKEIQESINAETTSPTFSGQASQGNPTATEIIELQRQAKMVLGLTVFSMTMLEWKLDWLRLQNLLYHWFNEEDKEFDEARQTLVSKFRQVNVERPVEGEGMGNRMVIPTKQMPSSEAVLRAEDVLTAEQGKPVRLIFVNPDEIKSSKLVWQIVERPKERKTSETEKLMFRAFMQDAMFFGPELNKQTLQEEFASVWNKDPKKLFNDPQQMQSMMGQMGQGGVPQPGAGSVSPRVNLPTAEGQMNNSIKTALGAAA